MGNHAIKSLSISNPFSLSNPLILLALFGFIASLAITPVPAEAGITDDIASLMPKEIYKPMKPKQAPEIYGPTPVNAQLGNQGLSVQLRKNGTISTYSWPDQSMYDQVKFHTSDRDTDHMGAAPNSGQFLGLQLRRGGSIVGPTLLRSWPTIKQTYTTAYGQLNDVVKTTYKNPDLGLKVVVTDLVPINKNVTAGISGEAGSYADEVSLSDNETIDGDAMLRKVDISYLPGGSSIDKVKLFTYSNFNLVKGKHPMVPTNDWAIPWSKTEDAIYFHNDYFREAFWENNPDRDAPDALFHIDPKKNLVATMGFREKDPHPDDDHPDFDGDLGGSTVYGYQVGGDGFPCGAPTISCGVNVLMDKPGAWEDFMDDGDLNNFDNHCPNGDCWTQQNFRTSTGMLSEKLDPSLNPTKTVILANAPYSESDSDPIGRTREARRVLADARDLDFSAAANAKNDYYHHLLDGAPLPDVSGSDTEIKKLARRSLITLVQNYDPYGQEHGNGAIVASIARQSPYAEDWPRDGYYFNYVLDRQLDLNEWVKQRNYWYAELQQKPGVNKINSGIIPPGNWAMNYYGDGTVGGIIPWEIDETGYMVEVFWDHYDVNQDETYLKNVYPNIKRSADFLVQFEDEDNQLQKNAHEDDHFHKSQTMVGAQSTWMGLEAAQKAAEEMYQITGNQKYKDDARRYRDRRKELGKAINAELWNEDRETWGLAHWGIPEIAWPVEFRSYDNTRMRKHLETSWRNIKPTFDEPSTTTPDRLINSQGVTTGLYETKFLIALAKADMKPQKVRDGMSWIAEKWATPGTNIMGEVWMVRLSPPSLSPMRGNRFSSTLRPSTPTRPHRFPVHFPVVPVFHDAFVPERTSIRSGGSSSPQSAEHQPFG
ncbi:MAG: glutaminase domain-containing protein [bacterium]